MKFVVLAILATFAVLEIVGAAPLDAIPEEGDELGHIRVKRFTCDVLSVEAKGVKLNHAACATHCLFRGRRGGYCNGKRVCICR